MISPSPDATPGARIPTDAEARAFARRLLDSRATGYSLSYRQRRVLSLATSDLLGFPVWAISDLERMPRSEVLAHVRVLRAAGMVHLRLVEGEVWVLPCSLGSRVRNRMNYVAKALGHGA